MSTIQLIDSHCHLADELLTQVPNILLNMQQQGISHALCIGTDHTTNLQSIVLAEQYHNLLAAVGIHPNESPDSIQLDVGYLLNLAKHYKVIAIGETGLDYFRSTATTSWQLERFIIHIEAARQSGLPLIIHTRAAAADTIATLTASMPLPAGVVIHCFTEDKRWAAKFLDLGCYISFSGIVSFKNAHEIQEAAKFVPLDRLLIETDSPYLAPVPFRGKTNNPSLLIHTAECIANLRNISLDKLATATSNNFFTLFKKAPNTIT
jgi:TatD DNase family protein